MKPFLLASISCPANMDTLLLSRIVTSDMRLTALHQLSELHVVLMLPSYYKLCY